MNATDITEYILLLPSWAYQGAHYYSVTSQLCFIWKVECTFTKIAVWMELLRNGRPVKQKIAYFSRLITYSVPWTSEESPASLITGLFAMSCLSYHWPVCHVLSHCLLTERSLESWPLCFKVNALFRTNHHHSRCIKCLPSALQQTSHLLKIFFDTSVSSLTLIYVIISQTLCLSSSTVWGMSEYTLCSRFHCM